MGFEVLRREPRSKLLEGGVLPELPKELNLGIYSKSYRDFKYDLGYIA